MERLREHLGKVYQNAWDFWIDGRSRRTMIDLLTVSQEKIGGLLNKAELRREFGFVLGGWTLGVIRRDFRQASARLDLLCGRTAGARMAVNRILHKIGSAKKTIRIGPITLTGLDEYRDRLQLLGYPPGLALTISEEKRRFAFAKIATPCLVISSSNGVLRHEAFNVIRLDTSGRPQGPEVSPNGRYALVDILQNQPERLAYPIEDEVLHLGGQTFRLSNFLDMIEIRRDERPVHLIAERLKN
jgi:hypothetical protein